MARKARITARRLGRAGACAEMRAADEGAMAGAWSAAMIFSMDIGEHGLVEGCRNFAGAFVREETIWRGGETNSISGDRVWIIFPKGLRWSARDMRSASTQGLAEGKRGRKSPG